MKALDLPARTIQGYNRAHHQHLWTAGKAEGMVRALEKEETADSFPASALRDAATWILDKDSAALLKNK
jgi:6-phosphogluconolactonase/glucosamine-6-phosphate isomerase/deaminase